MDFFKVKKQKPVPRRPRRYGDYDPYPYYDPYRMPMRKRKPKKSGRVFTREDPVFGKFSFTIPKPKGKYRKMPLSLRRQFK